MLQFRNQENPMYEVDGKPIWHSRSVALHEILFLRLLPDVDYILLTKRSDRCPDEIGKAANVSGYLDWNESAYEGLCREYYEETRLERDKLIRTSILIQGSYEQPYYVQSDPDQDARQNVAMRFRMQFLVNELPLIQETEETSDVEWVSMHTLFSLLKEPGQFAWNHAEVIRDCLRQFYLSKQYYQ